jgi:hypothetical protein
VATAPASLDETRQRAREVGGDLRERLEGLEPVVRERWEELEPLLRERWDELEPVVRERWDDLEPVVRQRLEELEPAARQAQIGLWRALRVLFTALAALPTALIKLLKLLAGTADEVAERGQQVGEEALKRRRRGRGVTLRRRTLVAYVAGGVGVGFVIGWLLGRQGSREDEWAMVEETPFDTGAHAGGSPRETPLVE